jgi:hypothetical protein
MKKPLALILAFAFLFSIMASVAVYATTDVPETPGDPEGGLCFCRVPMWLCGVPCMAIGKCPCTCYCISWGHPYCSCSGVSNE